MAIFKGENKMEQYQNTDVYDTNRPRADAFIPDQKNKLAESLDIDLSEITTSTDNEDRENNTDLWIYEKVRVGCRVRWDLTDRQFEMWKDDFTIKSVYPNGNTKTEIHKILDSPEEKMQDICIYGFDSGDG